MIKIESLSKSFRSNTVLEDISFEVKTGDVVAVIGSSGAGKSTLLRSINFLEKADKGKIEINDIKVDAEKAKKEDIIQLRQKTAMVFQHFNLFGRKTVLQNVAEGLIIVKKIEKAEAYAIAEEYIAKVGLSERINFYPSHLSGGQQQRVGIARALAMQPDLLLFDEPTSALDPELIGEVLDAIKKIAEEGNTMLLVSHEMNFVRKVATRVLFLDKGKIIEDGTPEEVFENPKSERTRQFLRSYYQDLQQQEYIV